MDDEQLVSTFEAGRMPDGGFPHAQHVRVAWCYLSRHPLGEALTRFTTALRRFAEAQGSPGLCHETVTTAYLLLINERIDRDAVTSWDTFAETNAELLRWKPSLLDDYYTPETLWSERARHTFLVPDRIRRAGSIGG